MIVREDDIRRELRIPASAHRIVSLVPIMTGMLFAFGDRVAGGFFAPGKTPLRRGIGSPQRRK
jgi:hypothetical protein